MLKKVFLKSVNVLKKALEIILNKSGYSIHKKIPSVPNYNVDQVIDVGVAHGTESLLRNYPKAKFFLIEPNPEYFSFIEKNICTNREAILFKFGASDKTSKANFKTDKLNSFITENSAEDTIEIPIKTLDDILLCSAEFDKNKKTLLKIDTEGHELAVLKGCKELFDKAQIEYIMLELRISGITNTYNPTDIFVFLNGYNFSFKRIDKIAFRGSRISYMDVTFKKGE